MRGAQVGRIEGGVAHPSSRTASITALMVFKVWPAKQQHKNVRAVR
jgi:hypothetical protein